MLQLNTTDRHFDADPTAKYLKDALQSNESSLGLDQAHLYYDFPLYRDLDGLPVISKVLLASPQHGVVAFGTSDVTQHEDVSAKLQQVESTLDQVFTSLYARLIRNNSLKGSRTDLLFPTEAALYAPFIGNLAPEASLHTRVLLSDRNLFDFLNEIRLSQPLFEETFAELIATIEGVKGIFRPRHRDIADKAPNSKGSLASKLETMIASFDQRQRYGATTVLDGTQRIRGLAGSGKTIVLAMKAAQMHVREPDATILYTFSTRSLYQHIQRLITRFYRQSDDKDPDWDRIKIMHAWGGHTREGVYFNACMHHDVAPITYTAAVRQLKSDPFGYVCNNLLKTANITPMFDYVFVDEGQDFPAPFLKLCVKLAQNSRLILAYDELQTIFQTKVPSPSEFLEPGTELTEDIVLHKVYRNPREILVSAHALGFGIYGQRIVQMLENKEHWEDIGYKVIEGDLVEGARTVIERPAEYSLPTISESQPLEEIVQGVVYQDFGDEITSVAKSIRANIDDGLLPEDILVVVVDDRAARGYLNLMAEELASLGVKTNNIHEDSFGLRDFYEKDCVTLSTVHKAKGNEAFMVYVMGVDALFSTYAGVRERNILYTAMSRAKGWVRVSGIGASALMCKAEIDTALKNYPQLIFSYPSKEQLNVMKRDLADKAIRKQKVERMLDQILAEMSPEEIKRFIDQRSIDKGG